MKDQFIKDQFLSYDLALKLEELGFNEKCMATITNYGGLHVKGTRRLPTAAVLMDEIATPLYQQAFLFLATLQDDFKICLDENGWYIYNLENEVFHGEDALKMLIEVAEKQKS